jgi:hypothetical protein
MFATQPVYNAGRAAHALRSDQLRVFACADTGASTPLGVRQYLLMSSSMMCCARLEELCTGHVCKENISAGQNG